MCNASPIVVHVQVCCLPYFSLFFSFVSYRITCILTVQHKAKHVISSVDSGNEYEIGSTGKEIRFKSVVISSHDEVVNR